VPYKIERRPDEEIDKVLYLYGEDLAPISIPNCTKKARKFYS